MLYRGMFLALHDDQLTALRRKRGDPARREYLAELEEEVSEWQDTAWYLLFNAFVNSSHSTPTDVDFATLGLVFLGGNSLHRAEWYVINWIPAKRVTAIAGELERVTPGLLRELYDNVNQGWFHQGDYLGSDKQFSYVLGWHEKIAAFFARHRDGSKHVVFTSQYN